MSDEKEKNSFVQGQYWGIADWWMRFFIMLFVPIILAVGSARLVMSPAFLTFEYNRTGFPEPDYNMTRAGQLEYGPYGVRYIINNEPLEYLGNLTLPGSLCYPASVNPCAAFNTEELSHMYDVQVVAQGLFRVAFWGGLASVVMGFLLYRYTGYYALRLALLQGSMLTLGLLFAGLLLAVTAWDAFFSGFHSLFFEDGTWQFYYWDTLIRLYPEQFWFDASLVVGVMTIGGALLLFAFSMITKDMFVSTD